MFLTKIKIILKKPHFILFFMQSTLRTFYPIPQPFETGYFSASPHEIHYEVSGNKNGKPVIILHGGPGGGSQPAYRGYFDPDVYKIVQMDQRGAGKSKPHCCLEKNTTWDLVEDIETLRKKLEIEKWFIIFGGSWGSTLSLAYAQTHPERTQRLVLRGIFLVRREEIQFFYQSGTSFLFPEIHEQLRNLLPEVEREDILTGYWKRLAYGSPEEKDKFAKMWTKYEMATSKLFVDPKIVEKADDDEFALAFASIETHYFINGAFFKKKNQLLEDAHIIENIPTIIVQGRYDVVCPATSAYELHKKMKNSQLWIIPDAGHSCGEVGIIDGLVRATDSFKNE